MSTPEAWVWSSGSVEVSIPANASPDSQTVLQEGDRVMVRQNGRADYAARVARIIALRWQVGRYTDRPGVRRRWRVVIEVDPPPGD